MQMALYLRCKDYGFECDFILNAETSTETVEELKQHFANEHGIDYATEAVIQMITNRGHTLDSIRQ